MEWNAESVLDALNDFERKPELTPILNNYLERIAKNGEIVFPWCKLKPLLKKKLEVVLDEFYETCPVETSAPVPNFEAFNFENLKKTILQALEAFTNAPFTIQRLCELVTEPRNHYNRTDKYMRGIEKNILVVSVIEPRIGGQGDNNVNNNVIVNGMINDSPRDDNDTLNGHESESVDSVSSSNMNTSANHALLENFANVFPSAACIPSASTMCINRDIDSNFISTSESIESQDEIEFDRSEPATEEPAGAATEPKEDPMEISDEESFHDHEVSMDSEETISQELPKSETKDKDIDVSIELECDSSNITDEHSVESKDNHNEADSSVPIELPPSESNVITPQVEVISQSDEVSDISLDEKPSQDIDEPEIEPINIKSNEDLIETPQLQAPCSPLPPESSSPHHEPDSPVQGLCSPVQELCSPVQEERSCSPVDLESPPFDIPSDLIGEVLSPEPPSPKSPIQQQCSSIQESCSPNQQPLQETSDNVTDNSEMCVSESVQQTKELEPDNTADNN